MIRVGIVGTSWWTDSMYLPALENHPGCEVVALCGRNADTAGDLARRWGVANVFTDWRDMAAKDKFADAARKLDKIINESGAQTVFST